MTRERRFVSLSACPVRLEERSDGAGKRIVGYGAVFYDPQDLATQFQLWDDVFERIMPGCFDRALAEKDDCRGLYNHEPCQVLGRTSAGTMWLSIDSRGLRYEIDPPDTQCGRDVITSIQRLDVTGSSFSFLPTSVTWREEDKTYYREINSVQLFDVGPVTFPAYEATSAGLRSSEADRVRGDLEQWRAERERIRTQTFLAGVRVRVVEVQP